MSKLSLIIAALITFSAIAFVTGWAACHLAAHTEADQGYVRASDGSVWKCYRMQSLGLAGDFVAVYRKER